MPDPFPDELIYSVWARFSDHVGYPSAGRVFQDLFGDPSVNPTVDLPCHLQKFCNNLPTEVELNVDAIIDHHTLFPYYGPFLSPEKHITIRQQMIVGDAHSIHRRIGIARHYASRPAYLRYCPICLETDKNTFGESYWHRLHQVPGVEVCPEHEIFLENSPFFAKAGLSQKMLISAQQIMNPAVARDAHSSPFYEQLKNIAINTFYLLTHLLPPANRSFVREQYKALLTKQNYLTLTSIVRTHSILLDFANFYPDSLLALLHCEVDRTSEGRATWLNKLVRGDSIQYPLYHILALLFLKCSVQLFFQESQGDHRFLPFGQGPWPCLNPVCPHYKQLHIKACHINLLGISKGYRGVFSCGCGFTYSRVISETTPADMFQSNNIIAYGPLWQSALRELRQDSQLTLTQIAQRLGVSPITISRQVTLLGLSRRRKNPGQPSKIPSEAEIAQYREKWLKAVAVFHTQGRYVVARQSEGSYLWLGKYDPVWLDTHLPPRKVRQFPTNKWRGPGRHYAPGEGARVLQQDWEDCDRAIAEAIPRIVQELLAAPGKPQRVTLRRLRQIIPSLRLWPEKAAFLPLTEQTLKKEVETAEHFASRRVLWVARQYLEAGKPLRQRELILKACALRLIHKPLVQMAIQEAVNMQVSGDGQAVQVCRTNYYY